MSEDYIPAFDSREAKTLIKTYGSEETAIEFYRQWCEGNGLPYNSRDAKSAFMRESEFSLDKWW